MACFYCKDDDGFEDITSYGDCVECHKPVCIEPPNPRRTDNTFHGAKCKCDCGALVCMYDAADHAAREHRTVDQCFHSIALALGIAVVRETAAESADKRTASRLSPKTVDTYNRFLNFVTPGYTALAAAVKQSNDRDLRKLAVPGRHEGSGKPQVMFGPEFWSEGSMERIAALAVETMQKAWPQAQGRGVAGDWIGEVGPALTRLGVSAGLETGDVQALLGAVRPGAPVPSGLVRALVYVQAPRDAGMIADWMVTDAVGVPG
jgi:hypothetical protein